MQPIMNLSMAICTQKLALVQFRQDALPGHDRRDVEIFLGRVSMMEFQCR